MLKRFVKFICVLLCVTTISPLITFAEGGREGPGYYPDMQEITHHTDITDGSWYANGCRYVYHQGIMVGTSETEFSPHMEMTREMAVMTVVSVIKSRYNYHNRDNYFDNLNYTYSSFKDIEPGHWYSTYIQWAYEAGIIDGIGDGYFGLGQPVTRQDFIVMLYKTVDLESYDEGAVFEGDDDISDYAREAAGFFTNVSGYTDSSGNHDNWLYDVPHIINGFPDGSYHFKDIITRAEVAQMLSIYTCHDWGWIPNYCIKIGYDIIMQ